MEQCIGESAGHMSMIPNSPILSALCKAHREDSKDRYASFLQDIVNELQKEQPF